MRSRRSRENYRQAWLQQYTPYRMGTALGRWNAEYLFWEHAQANFESVRTRIQDRPGGADASGDYVSRVRRWALNVRSGVAAGRFLIEIGELCGKTPNPVVELEESSLPRFGLVLGVVVEAPAVRDPAAAAFDDIAHQPGDILLCREIGRRSFITR